MTETACPCCGQELPANIIKVDLDQNALIAGGVTVKLTPREAEVAHLLWAARPRILSCEYIADQVFREYADGINVVPVHVMRIRRKIKGRGLPVAIMNEAHRGYWWVDFVSPQSHDASATRDARDTNASLKHSHA